MPSTLADPHGRRAPAVEDRVRCSPFVTNDGYGNPETGVMPGLVMRKPPDENMIARNVRDS